METAGRFIPLSYLFFVAALSVFAVAFLLSSLSLYTAHPELGWAITFDLTVFAPLFYYFAIRNTKIPKVTVATVAGLGIITASWLLPQDKWQVSSIFFGYVLPVFELAIVGFIAFKAWKFARAYRRERATSPDIYSVFHRLFAESFGETLIARFAAFEATIVYYALIRWRKTETSENRFSYHKKRGSLPVYLIIAFVILAETVVLHMVVSLWSVIVAWILTVSSLYVLVLLVAHLKASYLRPIEFRDGYLQIRNGLSSDLTVELSDVLGAEEIRKDVAIREEKPQAALLKDFEELNVLVKFKTEQALKGLYGTSKTVNELSIYVDEKDRFINLLGSQHDA